MTIAATALNLLNLYPRPSPLLSLGMGLVKGSRAHHYRLSAAGQAVGIKIDCPI
jgi:hypothetical protein